MPVEVTESLRRTIAVQADAVLQEMRRNVPVSSGDEPLRDWEGKPRGHLRDAIGVRISKDGLRARVGLMGARVRKVFFYALFLEFGTRKMEKRPWAIPSWQTRKEPTRRAVRQETLKALRAVARSRPSDA